MIVILFAMSEEALHYMCGSLMLAVGLIAIANRFGNKEQQ